MDRLSLSYFMLFALGLFWSCEKNDDEPSNVNLSLSNLSVYERLPSATNVGLLQSDGDVSTTSYSLVSGDGDNDNGEFEILGNILRTKTTFLFSEAMQKSIRVLARNGGNQTEASFEIEIISFEDEKYPTVSSLSFENNAPFPRTAGADNGNISPDLNIENIPSKTRFMMLTMNDLDDGGSLHWIVWNIPASKTRIGTGENWSDGVIVGNGDFGEGYIGPFPPRKHRYEIQIYFLLDAIDADPSSTGKAFTSLSGNLIAQTSIIGTYSPN